MRTGRLGSWAVPGVLALLAVAPVRAQQAVPLPSAPRAVAPPTFPVATGNLPPAQVSGGTSSPGVEPLPQPAAHPPGPAVEHFPAAEGPEDDGYSFHGLYFTGDYLLLRPRRNAMDYAIVAPNVTQTPGGTIQSADWNTES